MVALKTAGAREVLIVGGFVRDQALGVQSKDIDIEVYGLSIEDIMVVLEQLGMKFDAVGKSFGVIKVGNDIDISVPRRENKIGVGHKGFDIQPDPDMSVKDAAKRRDFTVNALAMGVDGNIIDHFSGIEDIQNRILVATSDAFIEDPLRVLRGMQFAARFDFSVEPRTIAMCGKLASEFSTLAKERIWEEWKKWALKGQRPSTGLNFLIDVGWLVLFPEIRALVGVPQDPEWHPEGDVFIHTGHVVDAAAVIAEREQLGEHDRLVLLFSALTHDFGKPSTTKFEDGRWRAKRHCGAGVEPAEQFLEGIGAPKRIIEEVKPLISEHLAHAGVKVPSDRAIRRLANRIAPSSIKALSRVVEADHSGRPPLEKGNPLQLWVDKAHSLNVFSDKPEPILKGRHLIDMNVKPGRAMGVILDKAFEVQLDGGFSNLAGAQQWAKENMDIYHTN